MRVVIALALALAAGAAQAQFDPLSILGRAVTTAMDVRTKDEVVADTEISAGASKRLLDDKKAEWAGVTVLLFQQHVVLMGVAQSKEESDLAAAKVRGIKGVKSLKLHLRVVPKK